MTNAYYFFDSVIVFVSLDKFDILMQCTQSRAFIQRKFEKINMERTRY